MGWFEGAQSGATGGASIAGPWGALAGGLLGGLFGGYNKPKIPRELKRLYQFQYGLADQQRRFAQSAPLSDPAEMASYAQQRGQLGNQLNEQRQQQYGLYGLSDRGNFPSALANVQNQQTGSMMDLGAQNLLAALQQRRQALVSASGIAANAAGAVSYQQQPQVDLAGAFGDLARVYSSSQALKKQREQEQQQQFSDYIGQRPATDNGQPMGPQIPYDPANAQATTQGFNPAAQVQAIPQLRMPNMQGGGYQGAFAGGQSPLAGGMAQQGVQGGWNFMQPRYQMG